MAAPKRRKKPAAHRVILRIILNFWTILTLTIFIVDFLSGNAFDTSASAIGIVYLSLLGIYISEKEYSRWHDGFSSAFLGEIFVILWTAVMAMFVVLAPLSNGQYQVPGEFGVIYASVIAGFAISQHSKSMKHN